MKYLKTYAFKLGVVSSSKNCKTILEAAGIEDLFEVRVDGVEAEKLGLKGKPQPDTYIEASKKLNVEAGEAVVVEDAISGVQAGKNGEFGLVIGVARKNNNDLLKENGADIVVNDLEEIQLY